MMKNNISCQIIQDLLPNYIDDILSNESKELVRDHLKECVCCKKEWENMNTLIDVVPVEERKIDYLKGISKKCTTILLSCIILGVITFLILVFQSEVNYEEALFTLALYLMVIIAIIIKFALPLGGAILSIFLLKKTKKKFIKVICVVISVICSCLFLYSLVNIIVNR
ncbi:zf-HC2 domain-containing protein [Clostridium gasigenes]|uniref:zf-HC2 domain-containing protein n=1 Tax=Clostridium gasigenes TaxID=94869 RepID=UPI00209AFD20|nr:zf-HC2 domain-containing protein [Clostridium gasigenes]